ncbi:HNH endonuclease [Acinetobacter brisouii]|uniref:HNH endonuclease n=1 Tax=Acinetobacter brisouii TaxID=396323 RepID=UPI0005F85F5F|nr:HNH endonuclease [Acinetobacter brisouii]KJV38197.1 HNH endonuclease [Acinetobacter brisouii]
MARPCREYRCPNLVTSAKQRGYCDAHADKRSNWGKRPDRTGSTTERGYGHTWRKLREKVLQRDSYLCVQCNSVGQIAEATDVDHIIPKAHGGTDDMSNLQSLCSVCHKEKTANQDSKNTRKHNAVDRQHG